MSLATTAYLSAQTQHLNDCEQDLKDLRNILLKRSWTRLEAAAAARTLQVLIESCVGIAKHWVKLRTGNVHPEPRRAFEALAEQGVIELTIPWKKVIGLRNALVHDYLAVDADILQDVVRHEYYTQLIAFGRSGIKALKGEV